MREQNGVGRREGVSESDMEEAWGDIIVICCQPDRTEKASGDMTQPSRRSCIMS